MFCPNCGKEIDNVKYCPYCGVEVSKYTFVNNESESYKPIDYQYHTYSQNNDYNQYEEDDKPSAGFAILSFFIPIAGIILYIIWHSTYPKKAKSCLKGFITSIVLSILMICCFFAAFGSVLDDDYSYSDDYYEYYDENYYEDDFIDFDFDL